MNKEITAEDIIKAIDEMFDEEKLQENETFWRGYNHGIMRVQQYIVKLNQELQRKDNNWNELKKWLDKETNNIKFNYSQINGNYYNMNYVIETYENVLDKIKELEND